MSAFSEALGRLQSGYYNSNLLSPANPGGMANYGHVTNLPAALADLGLVVSSIAATVEAIQEADELAQQAIAAAEAAQAAALAAQAAAGSLTPASVAEIRAGSTAGKVVTTGPLLDAEDWVDTDGTEFVAGALTLQAAKGQQRFHQLTATTFVGKPAGMARKRVITLHLKHLGTGPANYSVAFHADIRWLNRGQPQMPVGQNKELLVWLQLDKFDAIVGSWAAST